MIGKALKYSYINAKVRAIKSRLLTSEDYHILISTKNLEEFLTYFRTTIYGEEMPQISSPKELTNYLYQHLFATYKKILRGLRGKEKEVIKTLLLRYEIENLKTLLRGIEFKVPKEKQKSLLYSLDSYSTLPVLELLGAKNIKQAILTLRKTRYFSPLTHALHQYESQRSLFPLEISLDLFMFKEMTRMIQHLSGKDKKISSKIVGILIDVLNILWIERFKEYYHLSPEEILNYAIEGGYRLDLRQIKRLVQAKEVQDLIQILLPPYDELLKEAKSWKEIRKKINTFLIRELLKVFSMPPFQIGVPLSCILLKELEVQNLIAIIEGKRLSFSHEKIDSFLTYKQEIAGV